MIGLQEAFDIAAKGLLAQGKRSFDEEHEICMYRAPNGCKCAVGFLISNEAYSNNLEDRRASDTIVQNALKESGVNVDVSGMDTMLMRLQRIHDENESWEEGKIKQGLIDVAHFFDLSTKAIDDMNEVEPCAW